MSFAKSGALLFLHADPEQVLYLTFVSASRKKGRDRAKAVTVALDWKRMPDPLPVS